VKILKATGIAKGAAEKPHRVVLREFRGEYVTHFQNMDSADDFYWGHYFKDLAAAEKDFDARAKEFART